MSKEIIERAENIINQQLNRDLNDAEARWGMYELGYDDNPHAIVEEYNSLIPWMPNAGFYLIVSDNGEIDLEEI